LSGKIAGRFYIVFQMNKAKKICSVVVCMNDTSVRAGNLVSPVSENAGLLVRALMFL